MNNSMSALVRKWWPLLPLSGLALLFLYTGWIGLDFGGHWDEFIHYDHVINTLKTGIILPFKCGYNFCYVYPSFTYLLSLVTTTLSLFFDGGAYHVRDTIAAGLSLDSFRHITRPVFLLLCSFSGLWLYLSLSKTDKVAACIAAAIPLLSWEYAYHARWIAPDAVMAQFAALWVMTIFRAEGSVDTRRWLIAATIAAAFATGTKYTAGALFFATVFFAWLVECGSFRQLTIRKFPLKFSAFLFAIFIATFLVITPGTILQPLDFFRDVRADVTHYATGHIPAYGVQSYDIHGGFSYFTRLWEYLGLALLSPVPWLSLLLLATAPLGFIGLQKTGKAKSAAALIAVLLFYSVFFSSRTTVFIVRNFLFFLPVLAVLIGAGIAWMLRQSRAAQTLAVALLCVAGAANAYTLVTAARTISPSSNSMLVSELVKYLEAHPGEKFALSKNLFRELGGRPFANLTTADKADIFVYRNTDMGGAASPIRLRAYPGFRHGTFEWIGPREVNYNYYPTWDSERDRILLLPMETARALGLPGALPGL